jgi:hypothetical protein
MISAASAVTQLQTEAAADACRGGLAARRTGPWRDQVISAIALCSPAGLAALPMGCLRGLPVPLVMERVPRALREGETPLITRITEINTKQDLSRWTRAHEKASGITWSVMAGPGGTMIIVEHEEDRASLYAGNAAPDALVTVANITESADMVGAGELVSRAGEHDRARLRRRHLRVHQRPLLPELATRGVAIAGRPRWPGLDTTDQSPCSLLGAGSGGSDTPDLI